MNSKISALPIYPGEAIACHSIREGVWQLLLQDFPFLTKEDYISLDELNQYRRLYLTRLVEQEKGELAKIDHDVMEAIRDNSILSENIQYTMDSELTFGQRLADSITSFGGSWVFIISFFAFLFFWILLNVVFLVNQAFDPYPFILLNLILSCVAAIQAPIIMMSQNRQEQKDRQRAEHDYKINLKAELEIKLLGEKIDHLLVEQNRKLLEIQEVQIDYLEDLLRKIKNS